ncbi:acyltransferase family protein [Photobacterium carnosum]|uniref:acyltransferase family protein n=1 Tax=Photobacterium carnosum TaxID=2023717 RepID=UPI001E4C2CD7|nr:acyltransferase family protein [Photobacterium carnosum]MCD9547950.1 acyltransferase family protein [Photobacterium carnosum]MCF2305199.1 acyltransferase family protein [Photobacterium carnosum]
MTKSQSLELKGIAILFMFLLHLLNTYQYQNIYEPFILINNTPLTFYISLYADICVAMFLFISGYGVFYKYTKNTSNIIGYIKSLLPGIKGLMINYCIILVIFCLILGPLFGYQTRYPGSIEKLLLNITAIDTSYSGAWWFLTTYLLLVFTSSLLFKFINNRNIFLVLSLLAISY